jgi:hypothetical protein
VTTKRFADVEGRVRAWARANAFVVAEVGTRTFFGFPDGADLPLLTLRRVGGGTDDGEAPIDSARISFECWGRTKQEAAAAAAAVKSAAESLPAGTPMGADAICYGASVELDLWLPEPKTDRPRYVVDVVFTVRATAPEAA